MAFTLTQNAEQLLEKNNITPQIVLQIDGVDTLYGAVSINEYWKVGDPGIMIGDPGLTINGQVPIDDQESLISLSGGTSNKITQVLNVDKGTNESISSLSVALLDKNGKMTELITPGNTVAELLGKRAKIWFGEADGSWKEDYFIVFRGVIDDIDAKSGVIRLNLASPDTLKKTTSFIAADTDLTVAMTDSDTTATVESTADFLAPFTNKGGTIDPSLKLYIKIEDEIMRYESKTGTTFGTITRGQLGTDAVAHDIGQTADSFYRLEGNSMDLALTLMMSGQADPYLDDFTVSSFVALPGGGSVANAVHFIGFDLEKEFNVRAGDYLSTVGATDAANNFTDRLITSVVETDTGYYVVVDGAALVPEDPTSATADFDSGYDLWGPGAGLGMKPEEVDITEHLDIKNRFLQDTPMDIYLKDEVEDGKEFLAEQLYNPVSAFAIPRKAQSSLGYHVGPIPGTQMITINAETCVNAAKLSMKRTINKNFFNTIIYKFDEDALEDRFTKGFVQIDSDSVDRIKVGNRALTIEAKGLRALNSAINIAQIASDARLRKYKFAAELIKNVEIKLGDGMRVEVGDKVVVDMQDLKLSDIQSGTRDGKQRIFEVVNKVLDISKKVSLDLVDTNFDLDSRFALIGPCSCISSGISTTQFVIKPTFTAPFGNQEWRKWVDYEGTEVLIRNEDWTIQGTATLTSASTNTITVSPALAFTPASGYYMELGDYDNQSDAVKLIFGFQDDGTDFADGQIPYQMS